MIVAAAILYGNTIYTALCHAWARDRMFKHLGHPVSFTSDMQGFITEEGKFVDRETAGKIVLECGQLDVIPRCELFSEDLFDLTGGKEIGEIISVHAN
jgi:hypothetical protein